MLRSNKCRLIALLLMFILSIYLLPPFLYGARALRAAPNEAAFSDKVAVMLVVDISGSMAYTDPQELRVTASELFIDLLSPEDYLGIIAFDHEAEVLSSLRQVGDAGGREAFKEGLAEGLKPRGDTNFVAALELAYEKLEGADTGSARPMVLFLTDGDPDPDPSRRGDPAFMQAHMDELWETVALFTRQDYPVYSIAFSDEINPEVMERIGLETRAPTYIHEDPAGLAESFFQMLGDVKNRIELWEEEKLLELHGSEAVVEFEIDEYMRQANLVFAGRTLDVNVQAPGGESTDEIEGVSLVTREGYALLVLQEPGTQYQGTWRAVVSGEDTARAMGNADFYVKTLLESPSPYSQYPLDEPLNFRVKTVGIKELAGAAEEVSVEIELRDPEGKRVSLLHLSEKEEGVFSGTHEEGLSRRGSYEVTWRVSLEGSEVSRGQTQIYARIIPVLNSDFWMEKDYRLGEEITMTAFFSLGGDRLAEGRNLQIDEVSLMLKNGEGSQLSFPLYDDGNPDHGDLKAGDGIYSARVALEEEGGLLGRLVGSGTYQKEEFVVEKSLGEFSVFPPGSIIVEDLKEKGLWAVPGRKVTVPLRVENESGLQETLVISQEEKLGTLSFSRVNLAPGEIKDVDLFLESDEKIELGDHILPLSFSAEGGVTAVQPERMDISLEFVSSREAMVQRVHDVFSGIFPLGLLLGIVLGVAYFGGGLFYRVLVVPRGKIKGTLLFWNKERENPDILPQEIKLGKVRQYKATVSLGSKNEQADFNLPSNEFDYDIIFENEIENHSPKFLQGWKALFRRNIPVKTVVRCSRPGILEFGGTIYTSRELFHTDEFESGGITFQYFKDSGGNGVAEDGSGVNILEGREWSLHRIEKNEED